MGLQREEASQSNDWPKSKAVIKIVGCVVRCDGARCVSGTSQLLELADRNAA